MNSKLVWPVALCVCALTFTACPPKLEPAPLEPMPRVLSFTASAHEVPIGGTVTLSWRAENATTLEIQDLTLGKLTVEGAEGSVDVAVTQRALFVLTARNERGATDSAVVSVRVQGEPSGLLFTSTASSVESGQPVTLAWSAPGADTVSLSATPGGAIDLRGQTSSGAVVVRPTTNTSYTLNAGGTISTLEISVTGRIREFSASPTLAAAGGTITLTWATANVDRVQVLAAGQRTLVDTTDPSRMASGTVDDALPAEIDPGQVFAYELKVTAGTQTLTRSVVIAAEGNPTIISFSAPTLAKRGSQLTLAWQTSEVDAVSLAANGVEIYRSPNRALALQGSTTLPTPAVDTTYVLSAISGQGSVTSTRVVKSLTVPTISLTATPSSVAGGGEVTLSWTGTDVRAVKLVSSVTGLVADRRGALDTGSHTLRVNAGATFTVIADNGLGDTASDTASISVTAPIGLQVAQQGALRQGQNLSITASQPGNLVGLPHTQVQTHAGAFYDIARTGTPLVFPATGNPIARINSPFRTVFFGRDVGQSLAVTKYGFLVFGDYANGQNKIDEALPSTKLEPMAVAPYWEELTFTGAWWQLLTEGPDLTLIVQWNNATASVQAKLHGSGQIDFEYALLPASIQGRTGVTGLTRAQTILTPTPSAGTGFTFFGPMSQPVQVPVFAPGRVSGSLEVAPGELVRVEANVTNAVISPDELVLTEVMPRSPLGVDGQWLELTSWRQGAIDLTGWSLTLSDGGVLAPLTGTVPPRGTLVLGATTDSALNDDAGVQVALSGFDLTGLSSLSLSRDGAMQTLSLVQSDGGLPPAGTSLTFDPGNFRYPTGNNTPQGPISCLGAQSYGSQRGSPGSDRGCGFPYAKSTIAAGYFDIASPNYGLSLAAVDGLASVSLAGAPVPFFGAAQTSMVVSGNGYLSFDEPSVLATQYFNEAFPSITNTNSVLAIFADSLQLNREGFADSNVYLRRVGQGVDPFAAAPHWIVQWHHVTHYQPALSNRDDLNFQVKLFDDGVIEYHFAELRSANITQQSSGFTTVTWLEAPGGTSALVVNANATSPGISPNTALRFTPRGTP